MMAMRSDLSSRNLMNTSFKRRLVARSMALALGRSIVTSSMLPSVTVLTPSDMADLFILAGLSETNQCIDGHRPFSRGPYDHRIDVDFLKRRKLRGCVAGDAGHDLDERIDIAARLAAKTVE